jgi:3-deoxy-manno-octulosonate cytidylyltransferase (CMP-KDO synthetase)
MPKPTPPVTVVIPARFGSSRFPGKPLALLAGKPLIQHVYERARLSSGVRRVLVATDDVRIKKAVLAFGGNVVMPKGTFRTGTDRVAAVARQTSGRVFVNLQGDEIALHPGLLNDLIRPFLKSGAAMGTLKRALTSSDEVRNSGIVKVVTDSNGDALYFSRAPIPCDRERGPGKFVAGLHYVHLGIYIYTREALLRVARLPTSPLEEAEKLEQLRALEHGIRIRVWKTRHDSLRIDTPADLRQAASVLTRMARRRTNARSATRANAKGKR